jgi:hypothetical protein
MQFRTCSRGALSRRVYTRFAGLFFALLLISSAASATTLVAVWAPDQLIIGADSTAVTNLGGIPVQASACKITQQDSTFFAFSGLAEDESTGFKVAPLAQEAVGQGASLKERIARFAAIVRDPLAKALDRVRVDSPSDYEYLQQGHPALQAIFGDVHHGAPSLGVVGISVMPNGSLATTVRMVADGDDGLGPRIIYAGQQTEIRRYLSEHHDWYNGDRSQLVRNLIQLEIDSSDGRVGGPVDVLRIAPDGAEWLQKKAQCAPVGNLRLAGAD